MRLIDAGIGSVCDVTLIHNVCLEDINKKEKQKEINYEIT